MGVCAGMWGWGVSAGMWGWGYECWYVGVGCVLVCGGV